MSLFQDIGGMIGAENAEDAQFAAAQQQLAAQEQGYQRAKKQYKPYANFGGQGIGTLSRLYGFDDGTADMSAFMESPDYQFRLQQGADGIQGSAAARGGLFSGATGKALTDYNQNTAASEFNNYVNRLFGFGQMGQQAAGDIANAALGKARNDAAIYGNIGQNQANNIMSQASALGSIADQGAAAIMGGFTGGAMGSMGAAGGASGAAAGGSGFNVGNAARLFFGA